MPTLNPKLDGQRIINEARLTRDEARVTKAVKKALAIHRKKVLDSLNHVGLTAAAPPDPFGLDTWDSSVDDLVANAVASVFDDLVKSTVSSFNLPARLAAQVLGVIDVSAKQDEFVGKVKSIGPDVARRVNDELQMGVAKGESHDTLTARITDAFDIGERSAMRISRTEVHGASESTKFDSAAAIHDSGNTLLKSWVAAHDDRTRESHLQAEEDNNDIPFDQPFVVGGSECDSPGNTGDPGEDVNCRCAATFRTVESNPVQSETDDESEQ